MTTIFLDIDGTLLQQNSGDNLTEILKKPPRVLPGVMQKLDEWHILGYTVILTSARPEGSRLHTTQQLNEAGIYHYAQLILGVGHGRRVVINDHTDHNLPRAIGIPLKRNVGIGDVNV